MVKVLAREPVLVTVMVPVVPVHMELMPVMLMAALHQPPATPLLLVGIVPSDETQATVWAWLRVPAATLLPAFSV
jgi:hypothetical protein